MAARRRIVVSGRVQGVWFRDSCRQEAQRLGISGWARNRADGSVEVVAEGEPEVLDRLEAWCRRGPSRADVDTVDVSDEPPEGLTGFSVR